MKTHRFDDSEHETYSDSSGKSGGQKEKLAYTILAASLAYQFKLEWSVTRSNTFRFAVIDEAFGRGSDESRSRPAPMTWTTPDHVRGLLTKRWASGKYLTWLATGEPWQPIEVPIRGPRPRRTRSAIRIGVPSGGH
ncbi:SbcC/MukB-like Walker B domain-containing protein [Nonomuraea sp. NPDC050680]|uniref:SbcC/MukB-like Walker B domain-containing protein n=1 Tax=Nonomuraea sp. NPDC050680 TaxID=3154630 RepID=UPI0033D057E4